VPYFARRFNEKRYIRTWLGPLWLILRPGLLIGSQVFVFGRVLGVETGNRPYVIVFLVGFIGWHLFSEAAYWTTRSLELSRGILRLMHLPRGTMLIAALAPAVVDAGVVLGFLLLTVIGYAVVDHTLVISISASTWLLIPAVALFLGWGLTIGLWLAVPGAQARDIRFGLRFVLNFWYFVTPIAYPLSQVPADIRTLTELNPLTAPVELFKTALLGAPVPPALSLASSIGVLVPLALGGAWLFFRAESAALDYL
jgi:lipopolysaccharide transport system permease protein